MHGGEVGDRVTMEYESVFLPKYKVLWNLYSSLDSVPCVTSTVAFDELSDTETYLAIVEQLIAVYFRLA